MSMRPFTVRDALAVGVIATLAIGAVSACFSEHTTGSAGITPGTCTPPPVPAGATLVFISNFTFSPATVHVKAGNSIAWVNCEPTAIPHTATGDNGQFNTGSLNPGAASVQSFPTAGSMPYHCNIHPSMKASEVVDP